MTQDSPAAADDPDIGHEPYTEPAGASFRPACSCGFRAPLTHDTEWGALRAAEAHAATSRPRAPARYTLDLDDTGVIHLRCAQHPTEPLLSFPGPLDGHEGEMREAVRDHDREFHDDDRAA